MNFNRVFHYKPSIFRYPYFWKHPSRKKMIQKIHPENKPICFNSVSEKKKKLLSRGVPSCSHMLTFLLKQRKQTQNTLLKEEKCNLKNDGCTFFLHDFPIFSKGYGCFCWFCFALSFQVTCTFQLPTFQPA